MLQYGMNVFNYYLSNSVWRTTKAICVIPRIQCIAKILCCTQCNASVFSVCFLCKRPTNWDTCSLAHQVPGTRFAPFKCVFTFKIPILHLLWDHPAYLLCLCLHPLLPPCCILTPASSIFSKCNTYACSTLPCL